MSEIESISIKQCPICGKEFSVLYPDMYRYKRTDRNQLKYFCSWSCLREFDKQKGEKIMTVLSDDQRAEAVRIALTGKSPMPFLKECGIKNPSQCFKIIKKNLKESDPETWAKIPGTFKNYNYKPKPMKVKQIETPETLDGGITAMIADEISAWPETPEKMHKTISAAEIKKKLEEDAIKDYHRILGKDEPKKALICTAVRHPDFGEFYFDQKYNSIDFRSEGGDELSLSPRQWKELINELPRILTALGVEL